MKILKSQLLLCGLSLILSINTHAALIERDLVQGSGDGLLTLDTVTGLQWVDITATQGLSNNNLLAGDDPYQFIYNGYRLATLQEVQQLFSNAGVRSFSGEDPEQAKKTLSLIRLIGSTGTDLKITGPNDPYDGPATLFYYADKMVEPFLAGASLAVSADSTLWYAFTGEGLFDFNFSNPNIGAALVKITPVPLPGSLFLLGSAIIGLFGSRKFSNK